MNQSVGFLKKHFANSIRQKNRQYGFLCSKYSETCILNFSIGHFSEPREFAPFTKVADLLRSIRQTLDWDHKEWSLKSNTKMVLRRSL